MPRHILVSSPRLGVMVLDSFHLILRHAGFLDKAHHPVQNVEPAYEAITAELDRLAELAGTSRPRELPHLVRACPQAVV
eukprot:1157775-Pelagomonas_calceolata.AAC.22